MKVLLKVVKIAKIQTEDGTTYQVILRSDDKKFRMAVKVKEDDWSEFQREYRIAMHAELVLQLSSPQKSLVEAMDYET